MVYMISTVILYPVCVPASWQSWSGGTQWFQKDKTYHGTYMIGYQLDQTWDRDAKCFPHN